MRKIQPLSLDDSSNGSIDWMEMASCFSTESFDEEQQKRMQKQMQELDTHFFNEEINLLIISDRLINSAFTLEGFFKEHTDIHILDVVHDTTHALKIQSENRIDILLIVGVFEHWDNYRTIRELKTVNPHLVTILYAGLTGIAKEVCAKYKIEYAFHRFNSINLFLNYMKEVCENRQPIQSIQSDSPCANCLINENGENQENNEHYNVIKFIMKKVIALKNVCKNFNVAYADRMEGIINKKI